MEQHQDIFDRMAAKWPSAVVARQSIKEFSGGILKSRYMANLDSRKLGPPSIKIGQKIAYPVEGLICWMRDKSNEKC